MIFRSILAAVLAAFTLCAAPQPLTTIQDTLYKADGTRFNGTLGISWTSFEAVDRSQILQQSTTITVLDGNLHVLLVPTTTATPTAFYTVVYNSDGRVQFNETWAVPSSSQPLRVRDVRVAGSNTAGAETLSSAVQESDIVGLVSDLGARPLKGPGYAANRVAWVNPTGSLETVTGIPSDCVRVDGTSGPCGGVPPGFSDNETPAGLVDGANSVFLLASVPNPASSLSLYRNGVLQKAGLDFTLNANSIQFLSASLPQPGDTLVAAYRLTGVTVAPAQLYPTAQVLCAGSGDCIIPAGLLGAGDRIEIRFDLEHQGSAAYAFDVNWGSTTLLHREASASDNLVTGRADLTLKPSGAQLSYQSWGTQLPFIAGMGTASDACLTDAITITVRTTGGPVTLTSLTVLRIP